MSVKTLSSELGSLKTFCYNILSDVNKTKSNHTLVYDSVNVLSGRLDHLILIVDKCLTQLGFENGSYNAELIKEIRNMFAEVAAVVISTPSAPGFRLHVPLPKLSRLK